MLLWAAFTQVVTVEDSRRKIEIGKSISGKTKLLSQAVKGPLQRPP